MTHQGRHSRKRPSEVSPTVPLRHMSGCDCDMGKWEKRDTGTACRIQALLWESGGLPPSLFLYLKKDSLRDRRLQRWRREKHKLIVVRR